MDRKEFLSLMGASAATIMFAGCLAGCKKSSNSSSTDGPSNVDFTLDLSQSANAALNNNGGYVYHGGVIVARTSTGSFVAVSQTCTHESYNVVFQSANNRFYCANHGATFSTAGAVTNGPASKALKQYNTALTGTSLRIYS